MTADKLTRERIRYLLRGAELEMLHSDYFPNIPERIELCRLALRGMAAEGLVRGIENHLSNQHSHYLIPYALNQALAKFHEEVGEK